MAFFPDTYFEANGVATLSRHLVQFAKKCNYPLLIVRGGSKTGSTRDGSVEFLDLQRSLFSFPLDQSLHFDPFLSRYKNLVADRLNEFKPDLVHMTGPGDLGFLALLVSHMVHVPLVASWHTNLHEYLARRLDRALHFWPAKLRRSASNMVEQQSLRGLVRFYQTSRFVFAPNQEQADMLQAKTGKQAFLMPHGVDLDSYHITPKSLEESRPFCIGYVGRLTTEKNVRFFAELERSLIARGENNFRFLIVGEGNQQRWLEENMRRAEFTGLLRGKQLSAAYNRMDAFVFPSTTDTFGLVVLEAMASGLPVILSPQAGLRVGVRDGVSGFLSADFAASLQLLMRDRALLHTMSCSAREFAIRHSWDAVFEQLYTAYAQGLATLTNAVTTSI